MSETKTKRPPRWLYSILTIGSFIACGIYLGLIRAEGASTTLIIRSVAFGILGFLMFWGALGKR